MVHCTQSAPPMPGDGADCHPASWAYPFFTMSRNRCLRQRNVDSSTLDVGPLMRHLIGATSSGPPRRVQRIWSCTGGARRDRTDDLLLAKQALSQLSYGPVQVA